MSFQSRQFALPAVPFGAVVSFCLVVATLAVLTVVALTGVGLVEWGLQ